MTEARIFLVLLFISEAMSNKFNAKIFFFFGETYDFNKIYKLEVAERVIDHQGFDNTKPIMLYSHGYLESAESDTVRAIVDAYIQNDNYNILVIDWRDLADGIYPFVAADLKELGSQTAALLIRLRKRIPIDQLHVVGHSLGGQLAGYIGRLFKYQSGGTNLTRLSALDPAGPNFSVFRINTERITEKDATFVDVIHTDAGALGYWNSTGTADFWPNGGGRSQRGCFPFTDVLCSHQRSVYYFAESVRRGSSPSFTSFNPVSGDRVEMGLNCLQSAAGNYFLTTNWASPFSRG